MHHFKYRGIKSSDFYLEIKSDMIYTSPSADIELLPIPGKDGEVAISKDRLNGTSLPFQCSIRLPEGKTIEEVSNEISNWLKIDPEWSELTYTADPDFIYTALFYEEYNIERMLSWYGKVVLPFRIKPYKYYKEGLEELPLSNGQTINNIGTRPSKPLIKITGSGNIQLTINDYVVNLQSVQDGVLLDSLAESIHSLDGESPQWDKLYTYPFPKLKLGDNTISWTGADSVSIIPRWEAVVT